MQTWDLTYHPNGHTYTLCEKMSKKSAQDLLLKLHRHDELVLALRNAKGKEEEVQLKEEWHRAVKGIAMRGSLVFRRCLGLTQEQIDNIKPRRSWRFCLRF